MFYFFLYYIEPCYNCPACTFICMYNTGISCPHCTWSIECPCGSTVTGVMFFYRIDLTFRAFWCHMVRLTWVNIGSGNGWFNIKMLIYQYRKSHWGDKMVVRLSYLHNGNSYTGKTISLYWIRALMASSHYLNQGWLIIKCVLWHAPESNFTRTAHELNP